MIALSKALKIASYKRDRKIFYIVGYLIMTRASRQENIKITEVEDFLELQN
jgi:hypothetical protein